MALVPFYFAVLAVLCGSGAFRITLVFAAMQVVETNRFVLQSWTTCYHASQLIHQDPDGKKWLKFRPSSHIITRLVLGHLDAFQEGQEPQFGSVSQGEGAALEGEGGFASI